MRGLDTNILVRYLAADDEKQLAAADRLMAQCRRRQEQLFVPVLVVCETVWVLESKGRLRRLCHLQDIRSERVPRYG
jgi:predicted nucleic-acid-binding protein